MGIICLHYMGVHSTSPQSPITESASNKNSYHGTRFRTPKNNLEVEDHTISFYSAHPA